MPTYQPPRVLQGHLGRIQSLLFDKDGKTLVVGSDRSIQPGAEVKVWDLATLKVRGSFSTPDYRVSLATLLPNQRLLSLGLYPEQAKNERGSSERHTLRLWDLTKGKELALFPTPPLTRSLLLFVPPNRKLSLDGDG